MRLHLPFFLVLPSILDDVSLDSSQHFFFSIVRPLVFHAVNHEVGFQRSVVGLVPAECAVEEVHHIFLHRGLAVLFWYNISKLLRLVDRTPDPMIP